MKRTIALLTFFCLLLSGCGASSNETAPATIHSAQVTTYPSDEEPFLAKEDTQFITGNGITIDETIVFDNGNFKLTAKEIDFSDNYDVKVKFLAENYSDNTISIVGNYFSINGITIYCNFYVELAPGKKANDFLEIRKEDLANVGIENIATIQAQDTYIYNKDLSKKILDFQFSLETSIVDGYQQKIDSSGQTVYNENGIVIKYRGIIPGTFGGEELEFYVENNSDSTIGVYVDNVSVNGFMVYGNMVAYAYPHCVTYETLDFLKSDLEVNDIDTIEEVSICFYGYDEDSNKKMWTSDEIKVGRSPFESIAVATDTEHSPEASTPIAIDTLAHAVESTLKSNFQNCEISYDETGLTADISTDGLASICSLSSQGNSEMDKNWSTVVDHTTALASKIVEVFRSYGYDNFVISVNIMNDQNPDNIILMTVNGSVVYNAGE